jgi:hypothetical protein
MNANALVTFNFYVTPSENILDHSILVILFFEKSEINVCFCVAYETCIHMIFYVSNNIIYTCIYIYILTTL